MRLFIIFFSIQTTLALGFTPIEPKVAWDKKEIRVCWGNASHQEVSWVRRSSFDFIEYSKDQKKWIKDIIVSEYNNSQLGIAFVGWEDCSRNAVNADVILFRFEPPLPEEFDEYKEKGGMATTGQKGRIKDVVDAALHHSQEYYKSDSPLQNVVILNTRDASSKKISAEKYIQLLALHEFGHTAGIGHQHIRYQEALKDPNCKSFLNLFKNEERYNSTLFAGAYDYNSVMNYCYINKLISSTGTNFRTHKLERIIKLTDTSLYTATQIRKEKFEYNIRIGLSAQDKHSIRCLYVYDDETRKKDCNYSF